MIIDHDKKFVFVHIPKTGGTAITRSFDYDVHNGLVSMRFPGKHPKKHWNIRQIKKHWDIDPEQWTIACSIRNPWDWAASDWEFTKVHADKMRRGVKIFPDNAWTEKLKRVMDIRSFDEFLEKELVPGPTYWEFYCCDGQGNQAVNWIMRQERLPEDIRTLRQKLGYPVRDLDVINPTPGRRPYRELYTDAGRQMVAKKYQDFNERFGYEF